MSRLSRRQVLAGGASAGLTMMTSASPAQKGRRRVLRLAHLTDIHVQPERGGGEGMAACLRHVHSQKDKPQLILTGGDLIMDAFDADAQRTRLQWDLFNRVLRDNTSLPVEHCIGNHDVWGWNKTKSRTTGQEPLHGKRWALEMLGLEKPYRSFDKAGWHFVVLDSTHPSETSSYTAELDDAQFEWLEDDLTKTPKTMPILVLSHIPILGVSPFFDGENEKSGNWQVPGSWMHIDARRLKDLFKKHPNVKLCLSGHMHLQDRAEYLGVTYICNGAVCGSWWNGSYHEFPPAYALVDLFADGSFQNTFVPYGWKVRA